MGGMGRHGAGGGPVSSMWLSCGGRWPSCACLKTLRGGEQADSRAAGDTQHAARSSRLQAALGLAVRWREAASGGRKEAGAGAQRESAREKRRDRLSPFIEVAEQRRAVDVTS